MNLRRGSEVTARCWPSLKGTITQKGSKIRRGALLAEGREQDGDIESVKKSGKDTGLKGFTCMEIL